jgi:hypothetical protein
MRVGDRQKEKQPQILRLGPPRRTPLRMTKHGCSAGHEPRTKVRLIDGFQIPDEQPC